MKQQIDELYMQRQEIESEQAKVKLSAYRKDEIRKLIESESLVTEFDDVIFKNLVKGIKVIERHKIEIEFECGLKVEETV